VTVRTTNGKELTRFISSVNSCLVITIRTYENTKHKRTLSINKKEKQKIPLGHKNKAKKKTLLLLLQQQQNPISRLNQSLLLLVRTYSLNSSFNLRFTFLGFVFLKSISIDFTVSSIKLLNTL